MMYLRKPYNIFLPEMNKLYTELKRVNWIIIIVSIGLLFALMILFLISF